MSKRLAVLFIAIVVVIAILPGCLRTPRSETIIIPDSEEDIMNDSRDEAIEVKTIYRLPNQEEDTRIWLGWMDKDAILGVYGVTNGQTKGVERSNYPYENAMKLWDFDENTVIDSLSPDGRYAAAIQVGGKENVISLLTLSDQKQIKIEQLTDSQLKSRRVMWSNNSRYLTYVTQSTQNAQVMLNVFDIEKKSINHYSFEDWKRTDIILFAKVSDDGLGIIIVKDKDGQSQMLLGSLHGSEINGQYEQLLSDDGLVDWLTNDQIAFVDTEGSFVTYDRRNGAFSNLLEQIGSFQISHDRKYIAYSQGDTVYAGKLQGNNILNEKSIYQGLVPAQLAWSPDNSKLLINGWKPYEMMNPRQAAPRVLNSQPFVIEFK